MSTETRTKQKKPDGEECGTPASSRTHTPFQELSIVSAPLPFRDVDDTYLLSPLFVPTTLTQNGVPLQLAIIRGGIKLGTPYLNDVL